MCSEHLGAGFVIVRTNVEGCSGSELPSTAVLAIILNEASATQGGGGTKRRICSYLIEMDVEETSSDETNENDTEPVDSGYDLHRW